MAAARKYVYEVAADLDVSVAALIREIQSLFPSWGIRGMYYSLDAKQIVDLKRKRGASLSAPAPVPVARSASAPVEAPRVRPAKRPASGKRVPGLAKPVSAPAAPAPTPKVPEPVEEDVRVGDATDRLVSDLGNEIRHKPKTSFLKDGYPHLAPPRALQNSNLPWFWSNGHVAIDVHLAPRAAKFPVDENLGAEITEVVVQKLFSDLRYSPDQRLRMVGHQMQGGVGLYVLDAAPVETLGLREPVRVNEKYLDAVLYACQPVAEVTFNGNMIIVWQDFEGSLRPVAVLAPAHLNNRWAPDPTFKPVETMDKPPKKSPPKRTLAFKGTQAAEIMQALKDVRPKPKDVWGRGISGLENFWTNGVLIIPYEDTPAARDLPVVKDNNRAKDSQVRSIFNEDPNNGVPIVVEELILGRKFGKHTTHGELLYRAGGKGPLLAVDPVILKTVMDFVAPVDSVNAAGQKILLFRDGVRLSVIMGLRPSRRD